MLKYSFVFSLIIIGLLLAACDIGSQRRLEREKLEKELRRREPRRITEAEIIDAARVQGQEITKLLKTNTSAQDSCCPALPAAITDSVNTHYQAQINCFAILNPAPAASAIEQQLLEAYRYNVEQQLPLDDNVQAQGKEFFIYTAPVTNGGTTKTACAIWSIRLARKQVVLSMY